MKSSAILSLKLYLHPRDWYIAIINQPEMDTYGFQFWFFAITIYFWKPGIQVLDPAINDYTEPVKTYCCNATALIGIKFKCKDCGSYNTEAKNKFTCTGCGNEVNQMGGKYIE